jgi:general secretion pathway protein C
MKSVELILKHASRPLLLQFLSAVFVVLMIWDWVSGIGLFSGLNHAVQSRILASKNQESGAHESSLQSTLNQSLFGEYVPSSLDAAGVRQSMLDLKVVGVLFAVNEKDSQVLLQRPDGQEQFFRVGDTLSDGSMIKRITTEGVLVLRAGELERLSLPKEELQFRASGTPLPLGDED